jgi:hypothetical protein
MTGIAWAVVLMESFERKASGVVDVLEPGTVSRRLRGYGRLGCKSGNLDVVLDSKRANVL